MYYCNNTNKASQINTDYAIIKLSMRDTNIKRLQEVNMNKQQLNKIFNELDNKVLDNKVLKAWALYPEYSKDYGYRMDYNVGLESISPRDYYKYLSPEELEQDINNRLVELELSYIDEYDCKSYIFEEFNSTLDEELKEHISNNVDLMDYIHDGITISPEPDFSLNEWYYLHTYELDSFIGEFMEYYESIEEFTDNIKIKTMDGKWIDRDGYYTVTTVKSDYDIVKFLEEYSKDRNLNNIALYDIIDEGYILFAECDDALLVAVHRDATEKHNKNKNYFNSKNKIKDNLYRVKTMDNDLLDRLSNDGIAKIKATERTMEGLAVVLLDRLDNSSFYFNSQLDSLISLLNSDYSVIRFYDNQIILYELFQEVGCD